MKGNSWFVLSLVGAAMGDGAVPLLEIRANFRAPAPPDLESGKEINSKALPSLKLVRIAAKGKSFLMGSPAEEDRRMDRETQHEVRFTKDYYLATTVVTNGEFAAFVDDSRYDAGREWEECIYSNTDAQPVVNVSWEDAGAFCKWLGKKDGREYRLPTESEWEYACRAGAKTAYFFGDEADALSEYAWHEGNSKRMTHAVGTKRPNDWGLYDMHGNVYQWCSDWYGTYPAGPVTDPQGPKRGLDRIIRGGCWDVGPRCCRSASRCADDRLMKSYGIGFRIAASVR